IELVEPRIGVRRRPRETGHFVLLRRREMTLSDQQVSDDSVYGLEGGHAFRRRKGESLGIVERIARRAEEPSIPHQCGIESSVDHSRSTALVAGTCTVRADQII